MSAIAGEALRPSFCAFISARRSLRFFGSAPGAACTTVGVAAGVVVLALLAVPPAQGGACATHAVQRHLALGLVSIFRENSVGGFCVPHAVQRSVSAAAAEPLGTTLRPVDATAAAVIGTGDPPAGFLACSRARRSLRFRGCAPASNSAVRAAGTGDASTAAMWTRCVLLCKMPLNSLTVSTELDTNSSNCRAGHGGTPRGGGRRGERPEVGRVPGSTCEECRPYTYPVLFTM